MSKFLDKPSSNTLYKAIAALKDEEECRRFLQDLCTVSELLAIKQRFWVARLLSAGYIYTDIVEMTGASTATISRVNRCLNYGKGGYRKALERVKEEE